MGTVPNTFGTQAGGDVLANLLDANFSALAGISGSPTTGHIAVWGTSNNLTDGGALNVTAVMSAIAGLLPTAISGTNTTAAVTISAGQVANSTNSVYLGTSGNTSWSVTNGNAINGYAGGSTLPNSSTIHFFICSGASGTGTFASTSLTPTFPAGYSTYNRRIFSLLTNSSGALIAGTPIEVSGGGMEFIYTTPILDINNPVFPTSQTAYTLSVPTGYIVIPLLRVNAGSNSLVYITFSSPQQTGVTAASQQNATLSANANNGSALVNFPTNTGAQINGVANGVGSSPTFYGTTFGWIDPRRT